MAFHDSRFVSGWIVGVPMPGAQQNATGQGQIKAGRIKFLYALFFFILYSLSPSPSPSSSTSLFQVPGILIWLIHLSVNECASLSDCSSRIIHSSWRRQQCHYCTHTAPISQRSSTDFQHWRKKHIFGNVHRIKVWLSQKKKKYQDFITIIPSLTYLYRHLVYGIFLYLFILLWRSHLSFRLTSLWGKEEEWAEPCIRKVHSLFLQLNIKISCRHRI